MEVMLASSSVPWAALQMHGQNFVPSTACGPLVCSLSELRAAVEKLHGATRKGPSGVCAPCAAGWQQFILNDCLALQSSTGKYANLTFEFTVLFFSWEMSLRASSWDCLGSGGEWASVAYALTLGMHPAGPQHRELRPPGSL